MTVGRVKDFTFPHHTPPKTVKYAGGGRADQREVSGGLKGSLPETSGGGQHGPIISGGQKLARGGPFKHPLKKGALHRDLGIPQGQKIPAARLAKAEHSSNPLTAKRARLAETMKSWHHARGGVVHGANCTCPMCSGGMVRR